MFGSFGIKYYQQIEFLQRAGQGFMCNANTTKLPVKLTSDFCIGNFLQESAGASVKTEGTALLDEQVDHLSDHTYIKDEEGSLNQTTEDTEQIQCESCQLFAEIDPETAINPDKIPCEKCQELAADAKCKSLGETKSSEENTKKRKYMFKVEQQNCPHCNKGFHSQKRFDKHLPICKKNLVCSFCNKDFSGLGKNAYAQYQTHYYTHVETKPFTCNICSRGFIRKADLDRHKIIHVENYSPQRCNQCGAVFASEANLNKHMQKHNRLALSCDKCGQQFARQATLDKHVAVCQTETSCEVCGKVFKCLSKNIKSRYQEHMFTHTGERPYKCQFCDRGFRDRSTRRKHERTHTGEKPYPCTICDRAFSQLRLLRNHIRTHTGERPYACELCPLSFAKSCNLKYHMRVHTKEKPYSCSLCKRSFTQSGTYHKHMRRHTEAERLSATMLLYEPEKCEEELDQESELHSEKDLATEIDQNQQVFENSSTGNSNPKDASFAAESIGIIVDPEDTGDGASNTVPDERKCEIGSQVIPTEVSSESHDSDPSATIPEMPGISGEEITIIVNEGDGVTATLATIDVDQISSILASCS